ncbi:MAG TPA: ATP phosphoribosyltransferase regulatory subunit [Gammaproteobacteria bacterium]|nr:ATP phosphoribosyltransferase regulatory subunit [Gammaproteobacteria bacterium]
MNSAKRWLLPDGVEEILPEEAHKLETLRRGLLDLYESWGYELVIPPMIEFLESLLVGSSHDQDIHTFKITDQLSGRMMGIRADITPQVARIDAHSMNRQGPVRLCYADSVLHTKPRGIMTSRVPIRVGAELFGHAGVDCDIELIGLMRDTLQAAGIDEIYIVLGHVGIFRTLVQEAKLGFKIERELFQAVQRKAYDEIDQILFTNVEDKKMCDMLRRLTWLSGDESVLSEARELFESAPESVKQELEELVAISTGVKQRNPGVQLNYDLCELRGYEYHTGIVFAAYTPGYGRALAKGGRYDDIGEAFGRARPASGFDTDLKVLAKLTTTDIRRNPGILAPNSSDDALLKKITELRASGEIVVVDLGAPTPSKDHHELGCDRILILKDEQWYVQALKS